ncbi:MAG: tripartite tricarboxylate transporter substrate binding protein [Rhodovarius sp.]|nr:tripartite tricarboxylate transporter substrate binding protein [Rhodovarius sp.]
MFRRTLLAAGLAMPAIAEAQAWPADRPIRVIVTFPPGGTVDTVARLLTPIMSERLGRTLVVENRGGASGVIGTEAIAKSAPDGHTIGFVLATHAVNPALNPRLPYDTLQDFAPIGLVGGAPVLMAANNASPFYSLADVIAAGRRRGQEPAYGTIGNGSTGHLTFSQLQTLSGATFLHTPFRGGGPAVQAALAGTVPLVVASTVVVGPQVASGHLRGICVSSAQRSPAHPDIPTIAESGFPGFSAESWVGVLAPARTPQAAVERLNAELNAALATSEIRARFASLGMTPQPMTPPQFGAFIAAEMERWGAVVRAHQITAD